MKLREIAERLGAECVGDGEREIAGVAGIEAATGDQLTFVSNPKYTAMAHTTAAGAIIVEPDFPAVPHTSTLRIKNAYRAFAAAIELFYAAPAYPPEVHATAVIHPSATVGDRAHVGAYVVIDAEVSIGDDAVLLPHVVIYRGARVGNGFFAHAHSVVREHCTLGDDVVLQNGAVVGGDGFGFARDSKGWNKIVQSGTVTIGNRVEVQANACVDRASIGQTRIGDGSKIDNLVQVGHGSTVGEDTLLCAQVGLAGSSQIGSRVILAGQVGVAGHCTVGDGVIATAQSGIPSDVAPNSTVSGYPAMENRQWLRTVAAFTRLPDLVRDVRTLKRSGQS